MLNSGLAELSTGQVAFLSGLMAGFSITVAIHILRRGLRDPVSQAVFYLLIVTTLLYLVSLYVEVRLTIELSGFDGLNDKAGELVADLRLISTRCATSGLALFVFSIGLLGWIARPLLGVLTTAAAFSTLAVLGYIWLSVRTLQGVL